MSTTIVNPMPYGQANITMVLHTNPDIRNGALAGTIEANLIGFKGTITVTSKTHQFATGNKMSRIIYITPYSDFTDFLVNIKRFFAGVKFTPLPNNGSDITGYVMGALQQGSAEYNSAQQQTNMALQNGRRIKIIVANDLSNIHISIDPDSGSCVMV